MRPPRLRATGHDLNHANRRKTESRFPGDVHRACEPLPNLILVWFDWNVERASERSRVVG